MSDFIMIAPEGWMVLSVDYENQALITPNMFSQISTHEIIDIATVAMIERGDMLVEQTIEDIRLINSEFWVKLI
jgi:hypothetical protein